MKNRNITLTAMLVALGFLALAAKVQAVSPPPDGGYPNFNTAEGQNALFSLTTGDSNTAVGAAALLNNTTGNLNEAMGVNALASNDSGFDNIAIGDDTLSNNVSGSHNIIVGGFAAG